MNSELTLEEQEQIDRLKEFWQRFANLILSAALVAAIAFAGVQWWKRENLHKAAEAAGMYAALQSMQQAGQTSAVGSLAGTLETRYPDSPYSARAALIAAASYDTAGQPPAARKQLQWIIDHSHESALRSIAMLRLAGIDLDAGQPQEAVKLLDTPHDEAYADLFSDLKGDALTRLGQREAARQAYQIALQKLPADSPYRQVIEIKLNAIAGVAKP